MESTSNEAVDNKLNTDVTKNITFLNELSILPGLVTISTSGVKITGKGDGSSEALSSTIVEDLNTNITYACILVLAERL